MDVYICKYQYILMRFFVMNTSMVLEYLQKTRTIFFALDKLKKIWIYRTVMTERVFCKNLLFCSGLSGIDF